MSPIWIRTFVLVCIFFAVVLATESALRALASSRAEGRAINLRLSLIARGKSTAEALSILRRTGSTIPKGLPPLLDRIAHKFERMGEWIERVGWAKFFQLTGIEFTRYHIDDFKNAGLTYNRSAHIRF